MAYSKKLLSIFLLSAILFSNVDYINLNARITDTKRLGSNGSIISPQPEPVMMTYSPPIFGGSSSSSSSSNPTPVVPPVPEPTPVGFNPDIIVAQDGTGDYTNIQDAINAVPNNPTRVYQIYIRNGVYYMNSLIIKSHIWLLGESRDGVILTKQGTISREMIYNDGDTAQVTMQSMTVNMGQPAQAGDPLQPGIIKFRTGSHTDISFINLHVLNGEGEAITVANYNNYLVENCLLENVQTGVNAMAGNNLIVRDTTIRNTIGNGIYPQVLSSATQGCYGVLIEDCYLESAGDCAIDITCNYGLFEHRDVIIRNTEVRGGHIRISNAVNVDLINVIMDGRRPVSIDTGRTHPVTGESKPTVNVRIVDSYIRSSDDAIRINGGTDITVLRTRVETTSSDKSAIVVNARGDNLFQDLVVVGGAYGFSYSWNLYSSTHVVVDNSDVSGFRTAGFYDGNRVNSDFTIRDSTVTGASGASYGVWTENPENNWSVINTSFNSVQQNVD